MDRGGGGNRSQLFGLYVVEGSPGRVVLAKIERAGRVAEGGRYLCAGSGGRGVRGSPGKTGFRLAWSGKRKGL